MVHDNKSNLQPLNIIRTSNQFNDHPLLHPISEAEFTNTIKSFKPNKSPGPSKINLNIIKILPPNYIKSIKSIINAILSTQYWPTFFKTSLMIFIPKPGKDHTNPLNFRPISLIEILAKILEKIITKRLLFYLEYNNLIPESQFGFRAGRSTNHSLYFIIEAMNELRKQNKSALISSRDIAKAFDTVWFPGLLFKLSKHFGFCNRFTSLIHSYITHRIIIPSIQNKLGPAFTPSAGVPQGSCLGPILFLIFIHDLPKPIYPNTLIFQYADDCIHLVSSDSSCKNKSRLALKKLENELMQTLKWEENWKIKTSLNKSQYTFTGTRITALDYFQGLKINNIEIPITNPLKILGYLVHNSLNNNTHITSICKKVNMNINKLYKFNHAPPKIKIHLYLALIRPLIEYPSILLYSSPKSTMSRLQKLQNKSIRFITNVKLKDRIKSEDLHYMTELEPINIRLHQLARKTLYTIQENYSNNPIDPPYYKLATEFSYTNPPLKPKQPPFHSRITNNIFNPINNRKLKIHSLPPDIDNFPMPQPIFT